MTVIDAELLGRLDVEQAIASELDNQRDLLPVQVVDLAARDNKSEFANIIATRARQGEIGNAAATVLSARKVRHGRRPASAMALPERVMYRATAHLLEHGLAAERDSMDFLKMEEAPIENGADYVIVTDLSHFYATIQIDRLAQLLVSRTGEWAVVSWLRDFLHSISGGSGGLPQGNATSDRLADTLADSLLRSIRRRGYDAWRYSDDFRIGVKTYQEAVQALEAFDEEARQLGLFVNERKTFTFRIETYRNRRDQQVTFFTEAWSRKRKDLTDVDLYSLETVEPTEVEVLRAFAADELSAWAAQAKTVKHDDDQMIAARIDLGYVLRVLTEAGDNSALSHVSALSRIEPHLTPYISNYIKEMSKSDCFTSDSAVEEVINDTALGAWQTAWILDCVSSLERDHSWLSDNSNLSKQLESWAKAAVSSRNEVVAANAVWTLAVNKTLDRETWSRTKSPGGYSRPFSAAALAALPSKDRAGLGTADRLDTLVQKWAEERI